MMKYLQHSRICFENMIVQIILLDMHKDLKFVEDKMGISKHDVSKFVECYGIVKLFVNLFARYL
jgi:hypothetical protein